MRYSAFKTRHQERNRSFAHLVAVMLAIPTIIGLPAGHARAAEPTFEQILPAHRTTALLEHGGKVLRGLDGGGVIVWDRESSHAADRWTAGEDLSGNFITDMTWTGQHVWIATSGAGLTRVTNLETAPEFRQYINNLGSPEVSAVTGAVIGEGERVFYGMYGQGLGQINSGLSGNIYTADQDGLISNDITTLQMFQGDLFVGTTVGISLFANNVFTDQNVGLTNLVINDLALDGEGNLLAASNGGIHLWDPDARTWSLLGTIGTRVVEVAGSAGKVYALGLNTDGTGVLGEYDGAAWNPITLPHDACTAIDAGEDFWIGGPTEWVTPGGRLEFNYLGRRLSGDDFETSIETSTQVTNCEGVAFGADDTAWMGAISGFNVTRFDPQDDSYLFIFERPHAANDTLNLFPGLGPVLSIAGAPDGTVYAGQYAGGGVLKFNPDTATTDLMDPTNSGLQGRSIVNLVVHPDGPLIVLHDEWDAQRVEVLVEPDNWTSTASWVLPPMDQGLGSGPSIWEALVEKRDIIWFAVEGGGLVRWDVNGPDAGPNDPVTWHDQSDDVWYAPLSDFPSTPLDPRQTLGLARGRDGSLWAGGNGLVQFTYELGSGSFVVPSVTLAFAEKISAKTDGLVNGNVKDIAVDNNGDVWVATRTGLNRVSPRGDDALITAFIDLPNFLANPDYGALYSYNVISPLPGNTYAKIAPSPSGRQMLVSSDQGTTLITVGSGPGSGEDGDPLENVYFYPNPWTPGESADMLKVGGLSGETVQVDIYNLEGQVVFRDNSVAEDIGFWDGERDYFNDTGPVVSGLYVLKVTIGGLTTTRVLALVR